MTQKDKEMSNVALMDIGEHCSFCGQIDFLPFKCSCSKTFCSQHRLKEQHNCAALDQSPVKYDVDTSHLPSSKTLFPDRSKPFVKKDESVPTNIKQQMLKNDSFSALSKLKKFFEKNFEKKKEVKGPAKRMIEMNNLKAKAKGDAKVPATERIYVWVQVIDNNKDARYPVFISRGWPLGRGLDSMAQLAQLKNINNQTKDEAQRLSLFRKNETLQKLEPNLRCNVLKDGETVYLVRGIP